MLNDIRPPPADPNEPRRNNPAQAHDERMALGKHHARYMGEPTHIDPEYEMPMEERGSGFNVTISLVVLVMFAFLIFFSWWTLK